MPKIAKRPWVFALLTAAMMPATTQAGFLGVANDYNVFSLGDFTQQNTDSLGRVAVGGKFDPGGVVNSGTLNGSGTYTVASSNPTGGPANLVVGGNYRNGSTTINGNMVVGGNATVASTVNGALSVGGNLTRDYGQQGGNVTVGGNALYIGPSGPGAFNITTRGNLTVQGGGSMTGNLVYGGTFTNNNGYKFYSGTATKADPAPAAPTVPIDFAAAGTFLTGLSKSLGEIAPTASAIFTGNSAANVFGSLTFNGTNGTQDIFRISGADLAHTNGLTINGVSGQTIVINVDGTADRFANFGLTLNGIDRQHVLFNFYDPAAAAGASLFIDSIGILGSVLAPFHDINFAGGNIDGTLIGKSIAGRGESHQFLFNGSVTFGVAPVPEPASIASLGVGLVVATNIGRRRMARKS